MMCFVTLRMPGINNRSESVIKCCQVLVATLLLALSGTQAAAQTLVEDVELPAPVILQSGVPIPELEDAARQAIVSNDDDQSDRQHYTGLREYQLGTTTIKEYRYGEQLMSVEVINETGSTYIVEHNHASKSDERKPRSGVVVSTW